MKLKKLLVLLMLAVFALVLSACGAQGLAGAQGPQGEKGDTGATGAKGPTGDTGVTGEEGDAGTDGVGIEFSFTSEGIAWRYVGEKKWTVGVNYSDIFTVINEAGIGETVKEIGFDYIVNKDYAEYPEGAEMSTFGKTVVMGTTAFATLQEAIDAAGNTGSGKTVFVAKGQYEGCEVTVDNMYFYGTNVNTNGYDDRIPESEITTEVKVLADGVTFNGIKFTETANVSLAAANVAATDPDGVADSGDETEAIDNSISNVTFKYCYLDAKPVAPEGYNRAALIKNDGQVNNLVVENCYLESSGYCKNCITGGGYYINGFTATENKFFSSTSASSGIYCESIILYNAAGEILIKDNQCIFPTDNWNIYIANADKCTAIDILGNTLSGGLTNVGVDYTCGIRVSKVQAGVVCNILGNQIIDGSGSTFSFANCVEGAILNVKWNTLDATTDCKFSTVPAGVVLTFSENYVANAERVTSNANYTFSDADANCATAEDALAKYAEWVANYETEKLAAKMAALGADFLADFNAITGKSMDSVEKLDTNYIDTSDFVKMLQDPTLAAKWAKLYKALYKVAEGAESCDPTVDTIDWTNYTVKCFYLANVCGFLTQTQHTDGCTNVVSADFSDVNNVKAVLALLG